MSELTLHEMIYVASKYAEGAMAAFGRVGAKWHVQTRDGEDYLLDPPPVGGKIFIAAWMKMVFEEIGAVRVVYTDEAWYIDGIKTRRGIDEVNAWLVEHDSLRDYPGRVEAVIFNAEDDDGRMLCGRQKIIRSGDKPTLGPLEVDAPVESEGRFVGMLPTKGTRQ